MLPRSGEVSCHRVIVVRMDCPCPNKVGSFVCAFSTLMIIMMLAEKDVRNDANTFTYLYVYILLLLF